jgi:hypothetical protein
MKTASYVYSLTNAAKHFLLIPPILAYGAMSSQLALWSAQLRAQTALIIPRNTVMRPPMRDQHRRNALKILRKRFGESRAMNKGIDPDVMYLFSNIDHFAEWCDPKDRQKRNAGELNAPLRPYMMKIFQQRISFVFCRASGAGGQPPPDLPKIGEEELEHPCNARPGIRVTTEKGGMRPTGLIPPLLFPCHTAVSPLKSDYQPGLPKFAVADLPAGTC